MEWAVCSCVSLQCARRWGVGKRRSSGSALQLHCTGTSPPCAFLSLPCAVLLVCAVCSPVLIVSLLRTFVLRSAFRTTGWSMRGLAIRTSSCRRRGSRAEWEEAWARWRAGRAWHPDVNDSRHQQRALRVTS